MKVLSVYRTYFPDPPGGLQEAIRQICLGTSQFGVENTIFTLSPNPSPKLIEYPEGRVVRCRSWAAPASCDLGGISSFSTFRRLAHEADLIHYFFPWPFADVLQRVVSPHTPTVLTYISDIVRQRWLGAAYSPLMRHTLENVDAIVSNCPAYAQSSPVLMDTSLKNKVKTIPLGIDEHPYHSAGDAGVFDRIGLSKSEPFVLFIGVLRYYKGLHTLIRAATRINARIVIAGSGPEGTRLQSMAGECGATNVLFAGQVSDEEKITLLRACRTLVLPSHLRSEAYGMVLVEAGIFGKPQVSCEIGTGTSFVNAHGESGLVVPPENELALAEALNTILGDDKLAARLGQGARARYERLFSGPTLGNAYAQLYREVYRQKTGKEWL
ncbi:MAG: glycosyltransferase [Sideroxyarcus sp.]